MATAELKPEMNSSSTPMVGSRRLDLFLFLIVIFAMVFVFCLLSYSLYGQLHTYASGIENAKKNSATSDVVVLTYSRAADFAIVKMAVVFLGFITAFLGALYVLRVSTASFALKASVGGAEGSLRTSSPGLVMVALGLITVNCAMFEHATVDLEQLVSAALSAPSKELPEEPPTEKKNLQENLSTNKKKANPAGRAPVTSQSYSLAIPPFAAGSSELSDEQKSALRKVVPQLNAREIASLTRRLSRQNGASGEIRLHREDEIVQYLSDIGMDLPKLLSLKSYTAGRPPTLRHKK